MNFRPASKIYSAFKSIETNVFLNQRIWIPHDENNYQIANAIVDHSKQEIGLSLWGFATISRSMILTVGDVCKLIFTLYFKIASVTFTYLTLILQMGNDTKQ